MVTKTHHKLLGIKEIKPSENGRRVPLSLFEDYHEPYVVDKFSNKLLTDERTNKAYCDNVVTSSRYNVYTFFPKQLYFQFSKIANCYFMVVSILQMIPGLSTTGSYTTIIPLLIFMAISMAREGYDDYRRHLQDKEENNKLTTLMTPSTCVNQNHLYGNDKIRRSYNSASELQSNADDIDSVLGSNSSDGLSDSDSSENIFLDLDKLNKAGIVEKTTEWKNIRVGQIVKLKEDDWVPADMVLLASNSDSGDVYVETMALDGETNLKCKSPATELSKICSSSEGLKNIDATIITEDPNIDLYNFEGFAEIRTSEGKNSYALDNNNVIYRGSIIRNTECIIGLVVFTGEETKIRMNAVKNPRAKAPKLQKVINHIVIFMVCVVILLAAFCTMGEKLYYKKLKYTAWYIREQDAGLAATLMGFIIIFNTLIPLALYVTMEIIKVMQVLLLQWDIDMYHKPSNTPAEARTATILEELGQVSYVFSDKTGTLTDNLMLFRKFSVAGVSWLHDVDILMNQSNEIISTGNGKAKYTGRPSMASLSLEDKSRENNISELLDKPSISISNSGKSDSERVSDSSPIKPQEIKSSRELIGYIQRNPQTIFSKKVKFFLLSLALCHSCLPKKAKKNVEEDNRDSEEGSADDEIDYQSASQDELALVVAARDMGYVVYDLNKDMLTIKTYPNGFDASPVKEVYQILDIIEFSSSRKRMSIVLKFPDNRICLFCKGADNVILERLKNADMAKEKIRELSKQTNERKNAEADAILQRKSMEQQAMRASISSIGSIQLRNRPSLQLKRPSLQINGRPSLQINGKTSFHSNNNKTSLQLGSRPNSFDNYLRNGEEQADEVENIAENSKRSLHLQQAKKYGIMTANNNGSLNSIESYIPPDRLVLNEEYVMERTLEHIEDFSTEGLRTLAYSFKWLDKDEYEDWTRKYKEAKMALVDRNKKIEETGELIETNFELLGATAIEDKLQVGVAETVEKLRRAGIKMWMLTGDKRETAINIGYSCSLIKDYSTVVVLSNDDGVDSLSEKMTAVSLEIDAGSVAHSVVVIDGATLTDIESDMTLMTLFVELGIKADSVVCCRASPSQKANMVLSVRKKNKEKVTLAIGDGANDIAMIQSADIGIGITGKEGLQAARSSDYSIAQFRYLLKLLLVHGRYNYIRTSKFVMCTFYKELLFYLTQVLYQRQDAFTGSSLYESWSLSMFNTLFTSLPVICIGMFEKDLRASTLLAFPELYIIGRKSECLNLGVFIYWMSIAASQSVIVSFLCWYLYGFTALDDNTTYALCVLSFTSLVTIINTKCQVLEMKNRTKLNFAGWFTSVAGWMVWCLFLPALYGDKNSKIYYVRSGFYHHFGRDYTWWAALLIIMVVGILYDLVIQSIRKEIFPTMTDDFQILENDYEFRKNCEIEAFEQMKQGWTWPHESELLDADLENMSVKKRRFYKVKSFIKKGTTHQRKRTTTLPSSTELPAGTPSVVKKASANESNYKTEILPSGKMIRKRIKQNENDIITKKLRIKTKHEMITEDDDEDIEKIIRERVKGLEDVNGR
ncbi:hypothetical protein PACTADRAFT_76664 [Pachysolen tannophilus NRRL Y-2460]|uniref:Phospholipid-transporting ATPase n=1 Tax=Pachysolen tannophilus NRRL Y-2460 TaxID=669874 RepID=A0A1E4TTK7_PACTA|nr:hypothetical protein PACTADRAFT_76664 [Pachysolen tannophilus NRRL Y-2460]